MEQIDPNVAIKISPTTCWVYGIEVPSEYREGHLELFDTFLELNKNLIDQMFGNPNHRPDNFCIQPGKDGLPGPDGSPGGKGGVVRLLLSDDLFMTVEYDKIITQGNVRDRSDSVAHAIQVYSDLREYARIHKAIMSKKNQS